MSDRLYKSVPANTVETSTFSIPSGQTLKMNRFGGDAAFDAEVKVEIKVGTELIFVTHHSSNPPTVDLEFAGPQDVVIRLVNDSNIAETIGAWWEGYLGE